MLALAGYVQVMAEVYDEFVFVNPTKEWFDMLHSGPTRKVDNHPLMPFCEIHVHTHAQDISSRWLTAGNGMEGCWLTLCRFFALLAWGLFSHHARIREGGGSEHRQAAGIKRHRAGGD